MCRTIFIEMYDYLYDLLKEQWSHEQLDAHKK
jgi:hypothetical protein